jgi:hypothetical protein
LQLAGVAAVSARVLDAAILAEIEGFAEGGVVTDEGEILRLAGVRE